MTFNPFLSIVDITVGTVGESVGNKGQGPDPEDGVGHNRPGIPIQGRCKGMRFMSLGEDAYCAGNNKKILHQMASRMCPAQQKKRDHGKMPT